MKAITLVGKSNSGKTGSIKHTMRMLIESDKCEVIFVSFYRRKDKGFHCDKDELLNHINRKIEEGLTGDRNIGAIVVNYKGKLVGLTTYGDSLDDIRYNLQDALKAAGGKLDVFVCARHDENKLKREYKYITNNLTIFELVDPIPSDRALINSGI